jgi:hypothetical protein
MRSMLVLVLLAATAAAAPRPAAGPRDGLAAAVAAYERDAELRALDLGPQRLLSAAAGGGPFGWLHLRVGFWYPALSGDMAADGERLDFRSDLGLSENEGAVVPEILFSLGSLGFRLDAFSLQYEGENEITRSFTFGGVTFQISEDVASRVRINHLRLLGTLALVRTDFLELRLQGGVAIFDLDGRVTGSISGTSTASGTIPIPVVGVLVQAKVSRLLFEVDVTGLTVDFGDVEGTTLDARVAVGLTFLKVAAVRVGYRIVVVDGSAGDLALDGTLDGFFVGLSVSF